MKCFIHCWHGSKKEEEAVKKAGYESKLAYIKDPLEVVKKIHEQGDIYVAVSPVKHTDELGDFVTIGVSDDWFKQR